MSTDWDTWLGPAADELSDDQRHRFDAAAETIMQRADPDLPGKSDVMLSATAQYLLGEVTLDQAGAERSRTQAAARRSFLTAQQIALLAVEDGMSEVEAARRGSIDRMTVRKMLGKRSSQR